MKYEYLEKRFNQESSQLINLINEIVEDYQQQGYRLTTRQVYYQLVARGHIENTLNSYKRIASVINDGKLAGEIDWEALEDRTREFLTRSHWTSPHDIVAACAQQYHEDLWDNQPTRVFVIIEKEALVGVLTDLCHRYDVPLLAARGYPSGSVLREFVVKHLVPAAQAGIECKILHLGDHDPSGIDMTRDLTDRLKMFLEADDCYLDLTRLALNMDQIEEIHPPENPAKATDSRFKEYRKHYGTSSWELDALQPAYLNELVERHITAEIDNYAWDLRQEDIAEKRRQISEVAQSME